MNAHTYKAASGVLALTALLAGPILARPAVAAMNGGEAAHPQSYWHTNMSDGSGVLVGLSRVAARIQFSDGSKRIFSISLGSYERLRSYVGDFVSFDVRHNVLHLN